MSLEYKNRYKVKYVLILQLKTPFSGSHSTKEKGGEQELQGHEH